MKNYFSLSSIVLVFAASFFVGLADPRTSVNMDVTSLNELVNATSLNELVNATSLNELVNATSLKKLVIDSENGLKSCGLTLSDNESIEIINLTSGNTTYNINILTLGASAVNRTSKSVKMVIASLILPIGDVVNANTISAEVYFVNNTLYSKADGNWTSTRLALSGGLGTGRDRIRQSAVLLNESDIKPVGAGIVDGKKCYIVEITPQSGAVSSLIGQELGSNIPIIPQNISRLFNNAQLKYVEWIDVASHLPVQELILINMSFTPKTLGYPGADATEIYVNSIITVKFSDLNKVINIELPNAAIEAKTMPFTGSRSSASYPALFAV